MKKRVLTTLLALAIAIPLVLSGCSGGEGASGGQPGQATGDSAGYPNDTIKIIVPWGVGGGADVIARKFSEISQKYIDQPIIVENHTGASGTIGLMDAYSATADGYTMLTISGTMFSLTPNFVEMPCSFEDFTMLKGMRSVSLMILVNPDKSGFRSFDDVIAYGRENNLKFATSSGPGGDQYVVSTAAFQELGMSAEAVVYDSQSEVINAIVAGQVDIAITPPPNYFDYEREGTVKAVATFNPDGLDTEFGTTKAVRDWGVDVEFLGMDSFAIRADAPEEIKAFLVDLIDKVYADPDFTSYMEELQFPLWDTDTVEIEAFVANEKINMDKYVAMVSQ